MGKICWICKNSEEYFLKQKKEILDSINKAVKNCDNFKNNIYDITKEKLGFTDESKEKVRNIQKAYCEMTLDAVLANQNSFLQLEPNLEVIYSYCSRYICNKSNFKTVQDAIEQYLQEPLEERYISEIRENDNNRNALLKKREQLEKIKTFFIEKEITSTSLDCSLNELDIPFSQLGFKINRKIFICPICLSLFKEASSASFEVIEARRRAEEAANYDDWDDDYDDDY